MRERREEIVREHMEAENRLDFDAVMVTFAHPRYELIATGEVHDGEAEVREYFRTSRTTFPDQRNELIELHHMDDGVLAEFWLLGTHRGPLAGLKATNQPFKCRMAALFLFGRPPGDPGGAEGIVCERVYFDLGTILRQLGLL